MSRVFIERGSTCVWIGYDENGDVLLVGQDLGGALGIDVGFANWFRSDD